MFFSNINLKKLSWIFTRALLSFCFLKSPNANSGALSAKKKKKLKFPVLHDKHLKSRFRGDLCGLQGPHQKFVRSPWVQKGRREETPPAPRLSAALFPLSFILDGRPQHSGTANHSHGCYQNNMAAQQIGAFPSVLGQKKSPSQPHGLCLPWAMTPSLPNGNRSRCDMSYSTLFRSVSGLLMDQRIPKRLENDSEVSLVWTSAAQWSEQIADCVIVP